jgi:hypothetical protein
MYPANSGHTVGGVVQLSLRVGLDYNESLEAVKDDIASQVLDALSAIGVTGSLKIVVLPLL